MSDKSSNFFKSFRKGLSELNKFSEDLENIIKGAIEFPKADDPNFEYSREEKEDGNFVIINETWKSKNGGTKISKMTREFKSKETKESLSAKIKEAVAKEDYALAAELKKELDALK